MGYLLAAFIILVSYFLGKGFLGILYHYNGAQELDRADNLLAGILINIGLAEAAHLAAVLMGKPFSACVKLYCIALGACAAVCAAALLRRRLKGRPARPARSGKPGGMREKLIWFVVPATLIACQVIPLLAEEQVYLKGDMTLETVQSFLASDAIYQINPLTGNPYELGMPLRLKILCLPTLYGIWCSLFHLDAWQVVWHIVPALVLMCSYLVYWQLSGILFKDSLEKRICFLLLVILLVWTEDYMYGMDGFGALHSGFRGVSIRAMVFLPYAFSSILRKKWKLTALCILAEACTVWTFYGMGACLFAAAGMRLINSMMYRKEIPPCQN